jgi:4-hydroxythreonine-4-phosphate dehydrogenase
MGEKSLPLAITMGCPVGIGPEIILKFFASSRNWTSLPVPVVVIGSRRILEWCSRSLNISALIADWKPGDILKEGVVSVFEPEGSPALDCSLLQFGSPGKDTGLAMASYIEAAVELTRGEVLGGIITCPIAKSTLNMAGYAYPGHTEMLAFLCRTSDYAMMMAGDTLRVTLVTIHTGLAEVSQALSIETIIHLIYLTADSLQNDFGISSPRIAVAGLNPHAGEDGLFGDEEETIIKPAVEQMKKAGCNVDGPYPPDTVFHKAVNGAFDAVVCMYHDQGLIPFKLLHFEDGVNVTIGLPIVRTSVDHGTAYDIAGQGKANPASLVAAVNMASSIVTCRNFEGK